MKEEEAPPPSRGRYQTAQTVVVALLAVGLLIGIFVFQNTTKAKVHFLVWSASIPLAGALILAAVLGGIFAFLVAFIRQRQRGRELRTAREENSSRKP